MNRLIVWLLTIVVVAINHFHVMAIATNQPYSNANTTTTTTTKEDHQEQQQQLATAAALSTRRIYKVVDFDNKENNQANQVKLFSGHNVIADNNAVATLATYNTYADLQHQPVQQKSQQLQQATQYQQHHHQQQQPHQLQPYQSTIYTTIPYNVIQNTDDGDIDVVYHQPQPTLENHIESPQPEKPSLLAQLQSQQQELSEGYGTFVHQTPYQVLQTPKAQSGSSNGNHQQQQQQVQQQNQQLAQQQHAQAQAQQQHQQAQLQQQQIQQQLQTQQQQQLDPKLLHYQKLHLQQQLYYQQLQQQQYLQQQQQYQLQQHQQALQQYQQQQQQLQQLHQQQQQQIPQPLPASIAYVPPTPLPTSPTKAPTMQATTVTPSLHHHQQHQHHHLHEPPAIVSHATGNEASPPSPSAPASEIPEYSIMSQKPYHRLPQRNKLPHQYVTSPGIKYSSYSKPYTPLTPHRYPASSYGSPLGSKQVIYAPMRFAYDRKLPYSTKSFPYPPSFISFTSTTEKPLKYDNGFSSYYSQDHKSAYKKTPDLFVHRTAKSLLDSYIPSWNVIKMLQQYQDVHNRDYEDRSESLQTLAMPFRRQFKRNSSTNQATVN